MQELRQWKGLFKLGKVSKTAVPQVHQEALDLGQRRLSLGGRWCMAATMWGAGERRAPCSHPSTQAQQHSRSGCGTPGGCEWTACRLCCASVGGRGATRLSRTVGDFAFWLIA
eukprot:3179809-Prymnesium_polylepis.2